MFQDIEWWVLLAASIPLCLLVSVVLSIAAFVRSGAKADLQAQVSILLEKVDYLYEQFCRLQQQVDRYANLVQKAGLRLDDDTKTTAVDTKNLAVKGVDLSASDGTAVTSERQAIGTSAETAEFRRYALAERKNAASAEKSEARALNTPSGASMPTASQVPQQKLTEQASSQQSLSQQKLAEQKQTTPAESAPERQYTSVPESAKSERPFDKLAAKIRDNWLVFGGALIFFLGITFFASSIVAELSNEVRLLLISAVALTMLIISWFIRNLRRLVAMPLQGTAVAILVLCVYAAQQHYHLIGTLPAFVALVLLMLLLGILADLQKSLVMAMFGVIFGFAIPPLVSTGGGTLTGLFGYFALLHIGIFWLSLRQLWPVLNMTSFVLLLGMAVFWGQNRYSVDDLWAAQGFVTFYFVFYFVVIEFGVRHWFKQFKQFEQFKQYEQSPQTFGQTDADRAAPNAQATKTKFSLPKYYSSMFFLLPTLTYIFEYGIWQETPRALTLILMAMAGLYLMSARSWLQDVKSAKVAAPQAQVYLQALILVVLLLLMSAVASAASAQWLAAIWALAGLGIFWLSVKQGNATSLCLGVILQVSSWLAFLANNSTLLDNGARYSSWLYSEPRGIFQRLANGLILWNPLLLIILALGLLLLVLLRRTSAGKSGNLAQFGAWFINLMFLLFVGQILWQNLVLSNVFSQHNFTTSLSLSFLALLVVGLGVYLFYPRARERIALTSYRRAWPWIPTALMILAALPVLTFHAQWTNISALLLMFTAFGSAWLVEKYFLRQATTITAPNDELISGILNNINWLYLPVGIFWLLKYSLPFMYFALQNSSPSMFVAFANLPWLRSVVFIGLGLGALLIILTLAWRARWQALMVYTLIIWFYLATYTVSNIYWLITLPYENLQPVTIVLVLLLLAAAEYLYQHMQKTDGLAEAQTTAAGQAGSVTFSASSLLRGFSLALQQRTYGHHIYHLFSRILVAVFLLAWVGVYLSHIFDRIMPGTGNDGLQLTLSNGISYWLWAVLGTLTLLILYLFERSASASNNTTLLSAGNSSAYSRYLRCLRHISPPLAAWYQQAFIPGSMLLLMMVLIIRNIITEPTMWPLGFMPILNPIDLWTMVSMMLIGKLVYEARQRHDRKQTDDGLPMPFSLMTKGLTALAFVWISMALIRSLAAYTNVPWTFDDILHSAVIQPCLSILWTVVAMTLMMLASRRGWRDGWLMGSVLILLTVIKIFVIDLSSISILGYIFSFLFVGGLMLIIGYFAPIPHAKQINNETI